MIRQDHDEFPPQTRFDVGVLEDEEGYASRSD